MRSGSCRRDTSETSIRVEVRLDERGACDIQTGVLMFDHLLAQFAFHGGFGLTVEARSNDGIRHHVVEDVAIALGIAISDALGSRASILRYGAVTLPMDDALVQVAVDLGGRIYARCALPLSVERIEDLETVMIAHVITSFAANVKATIHVDRQAGDDPHHLVEAAFKALGRACAQAWSLDPSRIGVASTKGMLV